MKLIQKLIFISGIMVAITFFFYTLSFSTGWALGQSFGDFYVEAQLVNRVIFKWALWTLIFGVLNIIFNSHKNRNYYVSNFILITLFIGSLIGSAFVTLQKLSPLRASYLELNEILLQLITAVNYSTIGEKIFDYGTYISIILLIQGVTLLIFTIYKTIKQVKRAKIRKMSRLEETYE